MIITRDSNKNCVCWFASIGYGQMRIVDVLRKVNKTRLLLLLATSFIRFQRNELGQKWLFALDANAIKIQMVDIRFSVCVDVLLCCCCCCCNHRVCVCSKNIYRKKSLSIAGACSHIVTTSCVCASPHIKWTIKWIERERKRKKKWKWHEASITHRIASSATATSLDVRSREETKEWATEAHTHAMETTNIAMEHGNMGGHEKDAMPSMAKRNYVRCKVLDRSHR